MQHPPGWFVLPETTDPTARQPLLRDAELAAPGLGVVRGTYRLEYTCGRTAWT